MNKLNTLITFTLAGALALGATAVSAGELGAVTPNAEAGKFYIGGALSFADTQWEVSRFVTYDSNLNRVWVDCRGYYVAGSDCEEDSRSLQGYIEGGFAFNKNWEIYGRVGAADTSIDSSRGSPDIKFNFVPSLSAGVRGAVINSGVFSTGPALQINYFFDSSDSNYAGLGGDIELNNHWEYTVGWGFQGTWDKLSVYGGPMGYWSMADVDNKYLGVKYPVAELEQKDVLGAYAGGRFGFGGGWAMTAEAQYRSGFSIAAGIIKTF